LLVNGFYIFSQNKIKVASNNKLRVAIYTGLILFLISFLLPAYSTKYNFYGYECAYLVFGITIGGDIEAEFFIQFITRVHFLLLGLHNLILPLCVILLSKIIIGKYRWLLYLFVVSTLNAILFFFYNQFSAELSGEVLRAGYYAWAFSSLVILATIVWYRWETSINQ
jgi:hypothetical protein